MTPPLLLFLSLWAPRAFYFFLLLSGLLTAFARLPGSVWRLGAGAGSPTTPKLLVAASVAFVAVTWYYIVTFMATTVEVQGARDADMFFGAYRLVTDRPAGWLWSSQLLTWVIPGLCFMHVEATRARLGHLWAFVLFGFLGAISGAFAVFLAHVLAVAADDGSGRNGGGGKASPAPGALYLVCALVAVAASSRCPSP